jgi:hypothetical protein
MFCQQIILFGKSKLKNNQKTVYSMKWNRKEPHSQAMNYADVLRSASLLTKGATLDQIGEQIGVAAFEHDQRQIIELCFTRCKRVNRLHNTFHNIRCTAVPDTRHRCVTGVAIYPYWETDAAEWSIYDKLWLGK